MTGQDDLERTLARWFETDALSPPPAGRLDLALDATRRRRPRPAWLAGPGSHWVRGAHGAGPSSGVRPLPRLALRPLTALILLVFIIAALLGGAILFGARLFAPAPTDELGRLAYALDGDIYLADWDGRDPVPITRVPPGDASGCDRTGYGQPTWSPDGRYLAYRCPWVDGSVTISDRNGDVVASLPGVSDAIVWSPDSTRIATWLDPDTTRAIGVFGLDGTREASLTLPAGFGIHRDEDAHWSPDGRSLLISLRPDPGGDPRQTWELPLDGGTPQPVPADDPRSHWEAAYTADGAHVVYRDGGTLVVAASDGSHAVTPITGLMAIQSPREFAVWSPTGDRVAFSAADVGATTPFAPGTALRVIDVATREVTVLATGAAADSLEAIRFSPVGDLVLFSRTDADDKASLWCVDADGSHAQLLVTGTDEGDWQPPPTGS